MGRFTRRGRTARVGGVSLAALLLLGVVVAVPAAADITVTARPGELASDGLIAEVEYSGVGGARTNSAAGTLGTGAWVMDTGPDPIPLSGLTWVGSNALYGELLSSVEVLEYRTFIRPSSAADDGLTPWIRLEIDLSGDGDRDMSFEWIPIQGDQGPVMDGTWQTWDALNADGWRWLGGGTEGFNLGFVDPAEREPLTTYLLRAPNAELIDYNDLGRPAVTLIAGQAQPDDWTNLVSEVDGLRFRVTGDADETIIDFEPPFITAGDASGIQQHPADGATVTVPFDLSAINGVARTAGSSGYGSVASSATWTVTDSGGFVSTGSGTVPAGAATANVPVDIPVGDIPTDGSTKQFTLTLSTPINAALTGDVTATINVTGYAPVANVTPPSISGFPREGATLTAVPGVFDGSGPITRSYQWQVCTTTSAGSCANIPGANGSTYVPDGGDVDRYLRVGETAANANSDDTAYSAVVGPVFEMFPGDSVVLVDPATGQWHYYDTSGGPTQTIFFGNPGDYPIFGDWDGDGIDTPGLYRRSDGFVYLRNSNTQGPADIQFFFGNPGDLPLAGDFDGDGFDTVSIYRPSQSQVFVINALGQNNGGLGAADYSYYFGNPGDKPFTGDFDNDGIDSVGLHRESTGLVYFRLTNTQGVADNQFIFGDPGDRFVAGDWTQTGISTPALFRPANTTMYFRYTNTQGNADFTFTAGESDWIPVAGFVGD